MWFVGALFSPNLFKIKSKKLVYPKFELSIMLFSFVVFAQVWCVLEACCTAPACPLVGGPAVLCLAWRYATLTTAPRGVAAQTAAITMMCASAVCNCELSPSSYIILIVVIHSLLSRITHANMLAKNGPNTRRYCQFTLPFFTGTIFSSAFFRLRLHSRCFAQPIIP